MGIWTIIDQVGTILYLTIDLLVINIFLGPLQGGYYAPLVQLVTLMKLSADAICTVFTPVAYELVAKGSIEKLVSYTYRSIKFMGILTGLPISLLCGLSAPLLERWLGAPFVRFYPLAILLIFPGVLNFAVLPLFAINRGMNKVAVPAIATFAGGVANLVLAILFVKFTPLGIYGVAAATAICYLMRNVIFVPIYFAKITKSSKATPYGKLVPVVLMVTLVLAIGLAISNVYHLATVPRLIISSVFIALVYIGCCYVMLLNKEDKAFLWSLVPSLIKGG
jgi:membrane protein EpsK